MSKQSVSEIIDSWETHGLQNLHKISLDRIYAFPLTRNDIDIRESSIQWHLGRLSGAMRFLTSFIILFASSCTLTCVPRIERHLHSHTKTLHLMMMGQSICAWQRVRLVSDIHSQPSWGWISTTTSENSTMITHDPIISFSYQKWKIVIMPTGHSRECSIMSWKQTISN